MWLNAVPLTNTSLLNLQHKVQHLMLAQIKFHSPFLLPNLQLINILLYPLKAFFNVHNYNICFCLVLISWRPSNKLLFILLNICRKIHLFTVIIISPWSLWRLILAVKTILMKFPTNIIVKCIYQSEMKVGNVFLMVCAVNLILDLWSRLSSSEKFLLQKPSFESSILN